MRIRHLRDEFLHGSTQRAIVAGGCLCIRAHDAAQCQRAASQEIRSEPQRCMDHGTCLSIRMARLVAPGVTAALAPSRSPDTGVGLPDFDTRAVTTTRGKPDS